MPESNYIDMETLAESSEGLRASMDAFLSTELNYIRYLRNKEKYFIGIKSVAATPILMTQQQQQRSAGGGGGVPFWFPRRKRRKARVREPVKEPVKVPVRVTVPETSTVTVPETQTVPERQPQRVPERQPQRQPDIIPEPPVTVPVIPPIIVPETKTVPPVIVPDAETNEGISRNKVPDSQGDTGSIWNVPPGLFPGLQGDYEGILDGIGKDIYNPGNLQPGLAFSDAMALGEAWLTSEEPAVVTSTISAYNPSLLEQIGNIFNSWRADRKMRSEWMNSDKGKAFQAELNKLNLADVKLDWGAVFDWAMFATAVAFPGDAVAADVLTLANLLMKGRMSWALLRRFIGKKAVEKLYRYMLDEGIMKPDPKFGEVSTVPMASGGLLTSPVRANNILAGEAGPELVLPLSKVTDAIEAVYREGGSLMVGATQSFLANMNSPSARGVLNDANRISTILGTSPVEIASITIPDNILKSLPKIETENNKTTIEENKKIKKIDTKGKTSETDDLSFIKDPEKRAAIELIRKLENTDDVNTGFSKWFGDKEGGMKYGNLQGMTIQQIHDLQTKFLKDPQSVFYDLDGNKKKSAAVGSGQFIYLKSDAMRLLGIDPSKQKFTPQFQVSLIEAIAKEAGVDINEKLTIEDIRKLGTKWSSLTPVNNQTTRSAAESFKEYLKILPVSENKQSLLLKPFESFSKKSINEIPVELASKNTIVELPIPIVIPIAGPTQFVQVETEVVRNRKLPLVMDTFGKGVKV